ncbi:MAG: DUF5110 domain-containing protein [Clostridia bacterium]|nr:DUF5110 domain-containing protein [Clostridia bacterium]
MERFAWEVRPKAHKDAIVTIGAARFTVLTDRLLRLEYDARGVFEDRASQAVFYRDFPAVEFTVTQQDGVLTLDTGALALTYRLGTPFSEETLSIALHTEPASTWHFGEEFEDLGGTVRTLDGVDGAIPLGRGVCSRFGIAVIDDSRSMLLGEDGWVEVRSSDTRDVYVFGYGYDYRGAVADFMRLTGEPPLLPSYALGNWWSRYHRYTQQEYIDLMERFKQEAIPFSVAVVDMDWHITEIPESLQETEERVRDGWTGYTWNEELFPDYKAFLRYLHDSRLKTALNLHPHAGIRRHEAMYEDMARACGIDPNSGERVRFDILSKTFMAHYFDIVHHPYEEDGVDFWWMDWQQGTDYFWIHEPNKDGQLRDEREVLDPLWMLNHLHILDISRGGKRPMFFSRYSGPGSQRYPVGFSGDTFVSWESLKFQPYFTATASNIGYPWWSHDIGGHMFGYRDDELTLRWMQLGVFSPINRLHSTANEYQRKEPWCYGDEVAPIMGDWLRLRHRLFPYLYTMNHRTHTACEPLVQPMYYSHPKCSAAYEVPNQYWFGSELMVAAITAPRSPISRLSRTEAWLPKGDWFDFENGLHYASRCGRKTILNRALSSYPVLAKAGAIVPTAVFEDNRLESAKTLEILVFPGADNTFTLYEDGGDGQDYRDGAFATTAMHLAYGDEAVFTIDAAKGDLSLLPQTRRYLLKFRGFHRDVQAAMTVDGDPVSTTASYDRATNTLCLAAEASPAQTVQVTLTGACLMHDNADVTERLLDVIQKSQMQIAWKCELHDAMTGEDAIHRKLMRASALGYGCDAVRDALKELLTLTEDEYEGDQSTWL